MSNVTLKDKMTELTSIVKTIESFTAKNPELSATLDVVVSFDGTAYARISQTGDDLELEVYS